MREIEAPFIGWAFASILLGLGFTFFSGATEAWLVDALAATDYDRDLETVFGRAQVVGGAAMLVGSVAGGVIAQLTDLGVPYLLRAALLGVAFVAAWWSMFDLGFTPKRDASAVAAVREVVSGAVDNGLRNPPVRWLMIAAPFTVGVGFYAFYAIQPYLLELYGDPDAYALAGVAAAILAGGQIVGGFAVRWVRTLFRTRTGALLVGGAIEVVLLAGIGLTSDLVIALVLVTGSAIAGALTIPIRAAFLNPLIPSAQRATVLSFDSLMGSIGGVVAQPALGRVADVSGYAASYVVAAGVSAIALPFIALSRREQAPSDPMSRTPAELAA
jgi:MFS family permease